MPTAPDILTGPRPEALPKAPAPRVERPAGPGPDLAAHLTHSLPPADRPDPQGLHEGLEEAAGRGGGQNGEPATAPGAREGERVADQPAGAAPEGPSPTADTAADQQPAAQKARTTGSRQPQSPPGRTGTGPAEVTPGQEPTAADQPGLGVGPDGEASSARVTDDTSAESSGQQADGGAAGSEGTVDKQPADASSTTAIPEASGQTAGTVERFDQIQNFLEEYPTKMPGIARNLSVEERNMVRDMRNADSRALEEQAGSKGTKAELAGAVLEERRLASIGRQTEPAAAEQGQQRQGEIDSVARDARINELRAKRAQLEDNGGVFSTEENDELQRLLNQKIDARRSAEAPEAKVQNQIDALTDTLAAKLVNGEMPTQAEADQMYKLMNEKRIVTGGLFTEQEAREAVQEAFEKKGLSTRRENVGSRVEDILKEIAKNRLEIQSIPTDPRLKELRDQREKLQDKLEPLGISEKNEKKRRPLQQELAAVQNELGSFRHKAQRLRAKNRNLEAEVRSRLGVTSGFRAIAENMGASFAEVATDAWFDMIEGFQDRLHLANVG